MPCSICKIKNPALLGAVESYLSENHGVLTAENIKKLKQEFTTESDIADIQAIKSEDYSIHWNFHQVVMSEPLEQSTKTLASDVDRSEAEILYNLMDKQVATFNCLTNKINDAIAKNDSGLQGLIINPTTAQFYNDIAASIRANVKEIRELDAQKNGSKGGALEGLKALAAAIQPTQPENTTYPDGKKDLTTDEYDY